MHKKLVIENFKCFSKKTVMDLGKINICLGSNSVGKSSMIQSCILLRQIYEQAVFFQNAKVDKYTIQLNDIYGLQLGDSEHILSSGKEEILLEIDNLTFKLLPMKSAPMEMQISNIYDVKVMGGCKGLFAEVFYYLNSERIGPRKNIF